MSDVTVLCCWNNEKVYQDFAATLKAQTIPYELIGIDNRGNKGFTSCASAYNSVLDDVKTKYVVFSHQDILLSEPDALEKFVSYLDRIECDDILGVAGARFDEPGVISDIKHSPEHQPAGNPVPGGMTWCNTLDECFFGGRTEHFKRNPFDEKICSGWHLYAVEACLHTQSNYGEGGGHIYVCSVPLVHNSYDGVDYAFYRQLYRLCRKYSRVFPKIRTTCSGASTDILHSLNRLVRGTLEVFFSRLKHR